MCLGGQNTRKGSSCFHPDHSICSALFYLGVQLLNAWWEIYSNETVEEDFAVTSVVNLF